MKDNFEDMIPAAFAVIIAILFTASLITTAKDDCSSPTPTTVEQSRTDNHRSAVFPRPNGNLSLFPHM